MDGRLLAIDFGFRYGGISFPKPLRLSFHNESLSPALFSINVEHEVIESPGFLADVSV